MECYNLISCDPLSYPDKTNLCSESRHPLEGKVVKFQGKIYTLTYVGLDACVCLENLPQKIVATTEQLCTPTYEIFNYYNCETLKERRFGFVGITAPAVFKKTGDCECWSLKGEPEEYVADELVSSIDSYTRCLDCIADVNAQNCPDAEMTIGYATKISLPDAPPPDRGFSKCCYANVVLADTTDNDPYKNDFTGAWFQRELPNSTCTFKLVDVSTTTEYFLNTATYGTFYDFGNAANPDLTYYIVDWRLVLSLLGAGAYQIKKELTIAGIAIDVFSDTYNLKPFSIDAADQTARIDSYMDGKLIKYDTDFKDTGYKTSMRLRGFFGRAEYSFEQDNIAKRDYSYLQNTMSSKREYKFQGLQIPECITDELWNFILFGNELYISDYNSNNHSYKYEIMPVKLEGNAGTEFFVTDRGVNVNLTFSDRTENDRKINC